jgi:hypothetical protein
MDYSHRVQQISDKLAWLGKLGGINSGAFAGIVRNRGDARELGVNGLGADGAGASEFSGTSQHVGGI